MGKFVAEEFDFELEQPERGFSLNVGGRKFYIGCAIDFNKFLNEIAEIAEFKNFLTRSFDRGKIIYGYEGSITSTKSSVAGLKNECDDLEDVELSDLSLSILSSFQTACRIAVKYELDIIIE